MKDTFNALIVGNFTLPYDIKATLEVTDLTTQIQNYDKLQKCRSLLTVIHKSILAVKNDSLVVIDFNTEDLENSLVMARVAENNQITITLGKSLVDIVIAYSEARNLGLNFTKNVDILYRIMIAIGDLTSDMYRCNIHKMENTMFSVSLDEPISYYLYKTKA